MCQDVSRCEICNNQISWHLLCGSCEEELKSKLIKAEEELKFKLIKANEKIIELEYQLVSFMDLPN